MFIIANLIYRHDLFVICGRSWWHLTNSIWWPSVVELFSICTIYWYACDRSYNILPPLSPLFLKPEASWPLTEQTEQNRSIRFYSRRTCDVCELNSMCSFLFFKRYRITKSVLTIMSMICILTEKELTFEVRLCPNINYTRRATWMNFDSRLE